MILPQIVIDLSGVYGLMSMPLPQMWWTIFVYGGWIPIVYLAILLGKEKWLESRQIKYAKKISYILLSINVSRASEQSPKAIEHMFTHFAGMYSAPTMYEKWILGKFTPSMSFEYASIDGYTQFIVRAAVQYRDLVEASIFSQYPDAEINEVADYTKNVPHAYPDAQWDCWGTEFILGKHFAYPIRTFYEFEHSLSQELKDPLATLLETLSRLKRGEQVWIQILIYPYTQEWAKEAAKVAAKLKGKEVKPKKPLWAQAVEGTVDFAVGTVREAFSNPPEAPKKPEKKEEFKMMNMSMGEKKVLEGVENKLSKAGFKSKIRFVYVGRKEVFRKGPMISMVRGALGLFSALEGNTLKNYGKVAPKSDYFWQRWSEQSKKMSIISKYSSRSNEGATPFVLNVEELASLWHFPAMLVKAPLIKKVESKKVEPPFTLPEVGDLPSPPEGNA